jgi:uncharacterized NAD-dependent epimerase/dehydratase family protein
VTLGLIHGSAPHAYVLCHQLGQRHVDENKLLPMPSLRELVELHERIALIARPAKVAAIALNTHRVDEGAALAAIAAVEEETGLVTDDLVRFGAEKVALAVLETLVDSAC